MHHRSVILLATVLSLSACTATPETEDEIYDREVRKVEAEDRFLRMVADCDRNGGVMVYAYNSGSRARKLTPKNSDMARCKMRSSLGSQKF